jgi:phage head-tail adaptor, putative, SPP1 family
MIDPSLALQTAVRHVLTTDAAVIAEVPIEHIVDSTGQLAKFPAVVIGEGQTIGEFVTLKRDTTRVYLDLHVWYLFRRPCGGEAYSGRDPGALSNVASWSLDGYRVTDIFISVLPLPQRPRGRDAPRACRPHDQCPPSGRCMMRAGDLDRTIVIERATDSIAASGARTQTWAPVATTRAKLSQITTSDVLRNGGGLSEAYLIFQTYWIDGVTVADRVVYGSPLTIKSIREIGRRKGLEFTCEALQ